MLGNPHVRFDERDVETEAMVEPLTHRQTKGAATDMPGLPPPRHIPTLPHNRVPPPASPLLSGLAIIYAGTIEMFRGAPTDEIMALGQAFADDASPYRFPDDVPIEICNGINKWRHAH